MIFLPDKLELRRQLVSETRAVTSISQSNQFL